MHRPAISILLFLAFWTFAAVRADGPNERFAKVMSETRVKIQEAVQKGDRDHVESIVKAENAALHQIIDDFERETGETEPAMEDLLAVGLCYERLMMFRRAEELARRILKSDPANSPGLCLLFRSLANRGELREAESMMQDAAFVQAANLDFQRVAPHLLALRFEQRGDWKGVARNTALSLRHALDVRSGISPSLVSQNVIVVRRCAQKLQQREDVGLLFAASLAPALNAVEYFRSSEALSESMAETVAFECACEIAVVTRSAVSAELLREWTKRAVKRIESSPGDRSWPLEVAKIESFVTRNADWAANHHAEIAEEGASLRRAIDNVMK